MSPFSYRCIVSSCWGIYFKGGHIYFKGGHCENLYETADVPESYKNQYNLVSLVANETYLLVKGNRAQSIGLGREL